MAIRLYKDEIENDGAVNTPKPMAEKIRLYSDVSLETKDVKSAVLPRLDEESDYVRMQSAARDTIKELRTEASKRSVEAAPVIAGMNEQVSAASTPAIAPFSASKEARNYNDAISILEEFVATPEGQKIGFFDEVKNGVKEAVQTNKFIPFVGSASAMKDSIDKYKVATKVMEGKIEELTPYERSVYVKMAAENVPLERSKGRALTDILTSFPAFAGEFASTAGLYSGATKTTQKVLETAIKKVLPSLSEKMLAEGATGAGLRLATGAVSSATGATIQSLTNIPRIVDLTAKYQTPSYRLAIDDGNNIGIQIDGQGDSFEKALTKAIGVNAIDYITERIGEGLGITRDEASQVLKKNFLGKWMARRGIQNKSEIMQKISKATSWSGILGEVTEEEAAEFLQAPIEGRDYKNPLTTKEGQDRLITEVLGFGIIGLGYKGGEVATKPDKQNFIFETEQTGPVVPDGGTGGPEGAAEVSTNKKIEEIIPNQEDRDSLVDVEFESANDTYNSLMTKQVVTIMPSRIMRESFDTIMDSAVKPDEAMEKNVSDIRERWNSASVQFNDTVKAQLEDRVENLNAKIEAVKKAKKKGSKSFIAGLQTRRENAVGLLMAASKELQDEDAIFQLSLADSAIREAKNRGIDLGKYENPASPMSKKWKSFQNEFLRRIYKDNKYSKKTVAEVVDSMIEENGGIARKESVVEQKKEAIKERKNNVDRESIENIKLQDGKKSIIFDKNNTPLVILEGESMPSLANPEAGKGVYYHGTTAENKKSILENGIDTSMSKKPWGSETPEAFFAGDIVEAGMYGGKQNIVGVRVKDGEIVKTIGIEEFTPEQNDVLTTEISRIKWAKENRYDVINMGDELVIINTDKFEVFDPSKDKNKSSGKKSETDDRLTQEAKKYKTAEEFVKAQGETLYHGTNTKFEKFDNTKIGEATGRGDFGDGFYFTDDKNTAKSFAKDAGGDIVMEVKIPKDLKFADGNELEKSSEFQDVLDDGMGFTDVGEYLKAKGYDGIKYKHKEGGTEYVVYDADKIKTKSQLTDIWNEANKRKEKEETVEGEITKKSEKKDSNINQEIITVYHGGIEGETPRVLHDNFFMTTNRLDAERYAKHKYGEDGMVTEIKINKNELSGPADAMTSIGGKKLYRGENGIYSLRKPEIIEQKEVVNPTEISARQAKPGSKPSKAFERVQSRYSKLMKAEDAGYSPIRIANEIAKAIEFVKRFPEEARKIALGMARPPADLLETPISIAYSEMMREQKNWAEVGLAERSRSLRQTRRGQEIVMERGRVDENSAEHFLKEVLKARIELAGKKLFVGVAKPGKTESQSYEAKGLAKIKEEAKSLKETISKKKVSIEEVQKVLESLSC